MNLTNTPDSSEPAVMLLLDKVARASATRFAERIADLGIRPRHVGVLVAIARSDNPSQAHLAEWLGVGPSAVVALIDELEAMGAVTREPDPANRRRWTIRLTPSGQKLAATAEERARRLDAELLSGVPKGDTAAFRTTVHALANALGVAGK